MAMSMMSGRLCLCAAASARGAEGGGAALSAQQLAALRGAAVAGRRHVEIKTLCKETGLDRRYVLRWLKLNADAAETSEEAAHAFPAHPPATAAAPRTREAASAWEPQPSPAGERVRRGRPGRRFSKAVEDTLERVFAETSHPPDAVVAGIMELHRLPRRQILDWFIERRSTGRVPRRVRGTVPPKWTP